MSILNRSPKGNMWSAIPPPYFTYFGFLIALKQGSGPKGDEVLQKQRKFLYVRPPISPSIPPPKASMSQTEASEAQSEAQTPASEAQASETQASEAQTQTQT